MKICIPLAAGLAAAAYAQAQSCIWTQGGSRPGDYGLCVYDPALGRVILVNLSQRDVTHIQIWSWDGAQWTLVDGNGPPPRGGAGVSFDAARGRLVLFGGGSNGAATIDTWEWDGAAWTEFLTTGPGPRSWPLMAYDEARSQTVLYGGWSADAGYLADTWLWDGHSWALASAGALTPRFNPVMTYDSLRSRVVLCGWTTPVGSTEIWEWDGLGWMPHPTASPVGEPAWLVFDRSRSVLVLGNIPESSSSQTWELEPVSNAWALRDPGYAPVGSAAFDAARGVAVGLDGYQTMEYHGTATDVGPYIQAVPEGGRFQPGSTIVLAARAAGSIPIAYQWLHSGAPLVNGGRISGADTDTLTITHAQFEDSGLYSLQVSNACATRTFRLTSVTVYPNCYANCDGSTTPPYLNVNDFICFQSSYARFEDYANCDDSSTPPRFNINDFICFMVRFSAGCSAP